ncbi:hypothetical protein N7486_010962 [Penicillium sp. IBT 16267x]|nr:hypothetical protein N7486_010962 [Penicillium sp. IBT 16267x]
MSSIPSPGNRLFPGGPQMRQPSLSFLYRLECDIAKEEINIGAPHDAGVIRSIANILRGSVKGPGIEASILPLGGADWATVSMTLDAATLSEPPTTIIYTSVSTVSTVLDQARAEIIDQAIRLE